MRDHFWGADMGGVDWDAAARATAPSWTPPAPTTSSWTCSGRCRASSAPRTPMSAARRPGDRDPAGPARRGHRARGGRAGGSRAYCRGESSDPRPAPRCRAPASRSARATYRSRSTASPSTRGAGPAPLLAGTAGKPVELTVAAGTAARRVVVRAAADEAPLRYQDWVAGRRAARPRALRRPARLPARARHGRPGWAQLHRDLRVETAREGLVVDVRGNRAATRPS